jgi:hypothetical protein
MENLMDNLDIKVDGNKIVITVLDVTKNGKTSSTGKTRLIASTGGAQPVDHPKVKGIKVALNVMIPA